MIKHFLVFMHIVWFAGILCESDDACNNKYKNLVILKDILKNDPYAQVPAFISVPSEQIESFIQKKSADAFPIYKYGISRLLDVMQIQATSYRNRIRLYTQKIANYIFLNRKYRGLQTNNLFTSLSIMIEDIFNDIIFDFSLDEDQFIQTIAQKNHFLMARSSGLEDSATTANAGLYVSVAYVDPNKRATSTAMGKVVASYFNMQAIKNNLAAGLDLLSMPLCIPVLLQELVGEPFGGASQQQDIPVSGVAFTTNSALGDETFNVTEINTAYGHGEGVVASKVPVDRFYVTESRATKDLALYSMIAHKRQRLIPNKDVQDRLGSLQNPDALMTQPTLSDAIIKRLYSVLKKIEQAYGKPMDVEFIVKNGIIYIVQARPAMRHALMPSYITEAVVEKTNIQERMSVVTIVPGSSDVRIITDPREVIITDTLDEADADDRRTTAKAVFVGTWASSLSHAAVNFMGVGIPCMYVDDLAHLKTMVQKSSLQQPLVIDVQRRQVYLWNVSFDASDIIRGWYEHPMQRALSLMGTERYRTVQDSAVVPQDAALITLMAGLRDALGTEKQADLFKQSKERIQDRFNLTKKRMKSLQKICDTPCQKLFERFVERTNELLRDYQAALDQQASRLELLFYHKMLEALLYQEDTGILNSYTYRWFLDDLYTKQQIYGKNISNTMTSLLDYGVHCPAKELLGWWQQLLQHVDATKNTQDIEQLKALLQSLERIRGISLWFATRFYEIVQTYDDVSKNASEIIHILGQDYTEQMQEHIAVVEKIQNALANHNASINQPIHSLQQAENLWKNTVDTLITPFTDADFIAQFQQASTFVKMLLCHEMRGIVDSVDAVIKAIKSNVQISLDERKKLFMSMLEGFFKLSNTWLSDIMPRRSISYNSFWPLSTYLNKQKQLLNDMINKSVNQNPTISQGFFAWMPFGTYDPKEDAFFQKSPGFSVQAAMLGTGTAFERHYPETPEDMFMLIHQNSLMAVSATYMSLFSGKSLQEMIYLPSTLRDLYDYMRNMGDIAANMIGLEYTADRIALLYNLPLNNHSGALQIVYNIATNDITAHVQYLGEARDRWQMIALFAAVSPELSGLKLQDAIIFDKHGGFVSWAWQVQNQEDMKTIIKYLIIMNRISFGLPTFINYWSFIRRTFNVDQAILSSAFKTALPQMEKRIQGTLEGNWKQDIERNF